MVEESQPRRRHIITGITGFLLGFLACLIWQTSFQFFPKFSWHTKTQERPASPFLQLDPEQDPFEQMEKLRQQMMQHSFQIPAPDSDLDSEDSMDSDQGLRTDIVHRREDDKFVYLEISIKGLDRQSLGVEVTDGRVNLKGQVHVQNDRGGEMIESFNQTFPAPASTDTKKS